MAGIFTFLNCIDFEVVLSHCEHASQAVDTFHAIIRKCISNYVPAVYRFNSTRSRLHSYLAHIQHKLKRKATARQVYKSFRTIEQLRPISAWLRNADRPYSNTC